MDPLSLLLLAGIGFVVLTKRAAAAPQSKGNNARDLPGSQPWPSIFLAARIPASASGMYALSQQTLARATTANLATDLRTEVVRRMQLQLKTLGYLPGLYVPGVLDVATHSALLNFFRDPGWPMLAQDLVTYGIDITEPLSLLAVYDVDEMWNRGN
jgi:hypothetical protein